MASIRRYDPFEDLFGDFFKGYLVRPVGGDEAAPSASRVKVEVSEQDKAYKVHAELPGVKKEDIHIEIDGDQVAISAEVKQEKDVKNGDRVVHSERYYGKVSRAFRLGQDIDEAASVAKFTDGVLELTLPKKAAASRKQISVS
ncbi:MAG: Hsp20 family protein [Gammaproteobacteria bacterium]|nr:Hsp20 family protein [Gammaproteobacteria bacterium]